MEQWIISTYPFTTILQIAHKALLHLVEFSQLLLDCLAAVHRSMAVELSALPDALLESVQLLL